MSCIAAMASELGIERNGGYGRWIRRGRRWRMRSSPREVDGERYRLGDGGDVQATGRKR